MVSKNKTFIIAEIGNNHEGDFSVAKEMVRQAAATGVDAVKFQTFKTEYFLRKNSDLTRFNRLKSFELTYTQFADLSKLARSLGVKFISTPLDIESAHFLSSIVDAFKVASGDNNFYELLKVVSQYKKPLLLSGGVADLEMLKKSVRLTQNYRKEFHNEEEFFLLHCVSAYPVEPAFANLRSIEVLKQSFPEIRIGYSDHTIGTMACLTAVGLGASVVEKHFTLDNDFSDFRDHKLSADPKTMKMLVEQIRVVEQLLGSPEKSVQSVELPGVTAFRRSLVAAKSLPAGHELTHEDFMWVRPGDGVQPGEEDVLIGKVLKSDLVFGDKISGEMVMVKA